MHHLAQEVPGPPANGPAERDMAAVTELHRSLRVMAPRLAEWTPPAAPTDPRRWAQRYALFTIVPNPAGTQIAVNRTGTLTLSHEPQPGGALLTVDEELIHGGRYALGTQALLNLADDELCTATSWSLTAEMRLPSGEPVPDTRIERQGHLDEPRFRDSARPLVASWSLFAALQAGGPRGEPWRFTLLDELDKVKPGQWLAPCGEATVETAAGAVTLRGYDQFGEGILPTAWWLDRHGRLVACIGAMRACLLEPGEGA